MRLLALFTGCGLVTMPADTVPAPDWTTPQSVQHELFTAVLPDNWRHYPLPDPRYTALPGERYGIRDSGACWLRVFTWEEPDPAVAADAYQRDHIEKIATTPEDLPTTVVLLEQQRGEAVWAGQHWTERRVETRIDTRMRASHRYSYRLLARGRGDGTFGLVEVCWPAVLGDGTPAPRLLDALEPHFTPTVP